MNIDYSHDCSIAYDRSMLAAQEEVRIFCAITDANFRDTYLVAEDPHGPVSVGDEFYNMSDIHNVIMMYPKLRKQYKTNEAIADIINEWYNYSLDMYENHHDEPCINLKSWLMGARPEMLNKFND